MIKTIAALGLGLTTLVTAPLALASPCDPVHASAVRAPAPPRAAMPPRNIRTQQVETQQAVLRRADFNRDGRVSLAEARAFGRNQFSRADRDRNGSLSPWELRNSSDDLTPVSHGRGNIVTRAEFEAGTRAQFVRLDT